MTQYIKSDWIDKIIKIKEQLDKKCKCCNKIYCDIQRKPRVDTGFKDQKIAEILNKRSQTAIEGKLAKSIIL